MKSHQAVLFINTFEPVVPLYRDFASVWPGSVSALVSQGDYRPEEDALDKNMIVHEVWVPKILRKNRRWCAIFYWLIAPWFLLRCSKTTVIFLSQPPLFFILGSLIVRIRKSNTYLLHVMDLYPNLLKAGGMLRPRSKIYRLLHSLSCTAFNHAQQIIVIGRCMKDRVVEIGVNPDRISIIPNWAHPEQCHSDGEIRFRRTHGLSDKFVVMYSGNMGKFHKFSTILEVAKQFESNPEVVFVFVGNGSRRNELLAAVAGGASNILLLPYQDRSMLSAMLRSANIHFVSLLPGVEGLMVPSKFYGILSAGRPVIYEGCAQGEVAQVIGESNCGQVVEPGDIAGLQKAIQRYLMQPSRAITEGRRASEVYTEYYQPTECGQRYAAMVEGSSRDKKGGY